MSPKTLGFLGGGRVARILLGGWQRAGTPLSQVVICEPDDTAFDVLQATLQDITLTRADAATVGRQEIVFLAVHPPKLAEVTPLIAAELSNESIVVSLAPKVTIAGVGQMCGGCSRIARMIPNAPSLIGHGLNPIAWGSLLDEPGKSVIRSLLKPLGDLPEVPEELLEAYAIVAAMGPTYFWPQWLELELLAIQFGLHPNEARRSVRAMTVGAIELLCSSGLTSDEVVDLIPVKPLADFEPELRDAYRTRLTSLFEKIRPERTKEPN